jgi:hypothetical protein
MANPFDQFDAPQAANPFDQFDAPAQPPRALKMSVGQQLMNNPLTKGAVGIGEAALGLGTGLISQAVGGLKGIASTGGALASGKSMDEALRSGTEAVESVTRGAYQPVTEEGKTATKVLSYIPEKIAEGGEWVGGKVGKALGNEELGKTIGKVSSEGAMVVAPGVGVLRRARAAQTAPTFEKAAATYPERISQAEIAEDVGRAASYDAANAARRQGVVVDLPKLDTTLGDRYRRAIADPRHVQEVMSRENAGVPEMRLKQAVGIDEATPLTLDAINTNLESLSGPKKQIQSMSGFIDDGTAVNQIRQLVPERTVGMGREHAAAVERVNEIIKDIKTGTGSGEWAMSSIESLRKAARDIFSRDELTPEARNTAEIYKGTADAMEGIIERTLQTSDPQLLKNYVANRQTMAQTYLLKDLLDNNTQTVNLKKLANQTAHDTGVTGAFSDFGKAYANSPESFKPLPKESLETRFSRWTIPGALGGMAGTVVAPGLGSIGGAAAGVAISRALSRRAARQMASPKQQAGFTQGGSREALGYGAAEPQPQPLGLVPRGEEVPMGGGLAASEATVAALRAPRLAEVEGSHPGFTQPRVASEVPGYDFKLRQEVLTSDPIAQELITIATNAINPRHREIAFSKLNQMYGAGTTQELIGLQPLYGSGRGTKLGIETVKALRDYQ